MKIFAMLSKAKEIVLATAESLGLPDKIS